MRRKIPPDAFDFYLSLGLNRSYQAVADRYSASKQAVTNLATKQGWQRRLQEIESKAREKSEKKAVESMEMIRTRHLAAARVTQTKALEALKKLDLTTAMDAVRALNLGVKQERLLIGEPSERSQMTIERVTREEIATLLATDGEDGDQGIDEVADDERDDDPEVDPGDPEEDADDEEDDW